MLSFFERFSGLAWLTGPIFEKELRVSSRRRKNYLLRFAYLALLTVFVVYAWWMTTGVGRSTSAVFQLSRMPEVGKYIVTAVVCFQFLAIQFIAIVMLSSAISEEIHQRTLGALMTTPVGSLQIVLGKLLSKLLQLLLLLAISMPLLAIVRVFGGVPWDYVLSSLCVTLTAAIFAGSVSLAFSTYTRRPHQVIARTALVCFLLYMGPMIVVELVQLRYQVRIASEITLSHVNPFLIMTYATKNMLLALPGGFTVAWPGHCAIMAGLSALTLAFSAMSVRKVGLRQATGRPGMFASRKERKAFRAGQRRGCVAMATSGTVLPVRGPAIVWKEMRTHLIRSGRFMAVMTTVVALAALCAAYGYCAYKNCLFRKEVQTVFIVGYFLLGLLRTAASAAASVTGEKEARTWPVLLATPLTDRQIVFGKIIGSALQSWPFWLSLGAHVVVFGFVGYIHPAAILPLALLVAGSATLVSAVGAMFSSCFKRSSTSTSVTLGLFAWLTMPVCCPLPLPIFVASPLFAAVMILDVTGEWNTIATAFRGSGSTWSWFAAFLLSELALIVLVAIYLAIAYAASVIAIRKIRRKIF
ncbi:MAG: ABC transporter permease subunit [Planctomycetota bacterium]